MSYPHNTSYSLSEKMKTLDGTAVSLDWFIKSSFMRFLMAYENEFLTHYEADYLLLEIRIQRLTQG